MMCQFAPLLGITKHHGCGRNLSTRLSQRSSARADPYSGGTLSIAHKDDLVNHFLSAQSSHQWQLFRREQRRLVGKIPTIDRGPFGWSALSRISLPNIL